MDEEEKERVVKVEEERQARARALFEKQSAEDALKKQRKAAGQDQLKLWAAERIRQQEVRRSQNKDEEVESLREKKRLKETTNPWERVAANVELNAGQYVGQADVSRMR